RSARSEPAAARQRLRPRMGHPRGGLAEQGRQAGAKRDQRSEQTIGDEMRELVAERKLRQGQVVARDAGQREDAGHVNQRGTPAEARPQALPRMFARGQAPGPSSGSFSASSSSSLAGAASSVSTATDAPVGATSAAC